MARILIAALFLVQSFSALAEEPQVEITSFVAAGSKTRASELCGKVTGANVPYLAVKVTVDPNTNQPGIYNTLVGPEGKFCLMVVTYSGRAEASAWLMNREVRSAVATSVLETAR